MRLLSFIPLSVICSALLCGTALLAQNSTVAPRITAEVDDASLTTLAGNVPRMARAEYDQGEASPATELSHIRLVLSRSPAQQAALNAYLAELQDPASPNYRKWLTPAQFGVLYGPADADVATLVAWLQSHGLTVEPVPAGRTDIAFSGTVSQVEEAFHASIHSFQANGTQFYSNTTDPQIPSALASVVEGVAHLNTIRPHPLSIRAVHGNLSFPVRQAAASPGLTDSSDGGFLYITPADAATIYDTPNFLNANFSGTSYTGAGVRIGVGGDATILASVIENYRSNFLGGSYATSPTLYYCTNSSFSSCSSTATGKYVADDADEAYLDTELSGGMAPGASIYYYASTDLISGIEAALNNSVNPVNIFSLSFGECEQDMSTSDNQQIAGMWSQAAVEGIAVTVSTGDTGSASCDGDTAKAETTAKYGLSVNGFASTPYNIAVGGTDFYSLVNSFSTYVSSSQGSPSTYYRSVLPTGPDSGYIPESTWNDSTANNTSYSENVPLSDAGYPASDNSIVAGGGGQSTCSTNNTVDTSSTDGSCISGYSKPSWQIGTGQYNSDGTRDIPDVALMSGNGFYYAAWLVCDDDTNTTAFSSTKAVLNCSSISAGDFDAFGGTSTAAPAFAGILALVEQSQMQTTGCTGSGCNMGQAAKTLYELYGSDHQNAIFHDVTEGNNSVPCSDGSPDCALDESGYYFETGYDTGIGYDLATGMGSVDATQLVNYWSAAGGLATPTVAVTSVSPHPATTAQSISVAVAVTGSSGTPTGTVTLTSSSYSSGAQTLVGGDSTFLIPPGSLAVGADTLTIAYSGDSIYSSATNTATTETVTGPTFTLSASSPASIAPGASAAASITVTGENGYAGTITLSCALNSYPSGADYLPSCSGGNSTVTLSPTTASGTATVTVSTTAATSELAYPRLPVRGRGLLGAGGGAVLALLLFLGIPARRRSWRSMLGVLVVMVALGALSGCSSSTSSGNNTGTSGTTAGTYTFTVTGTGNDSARTTETTVFSVTVQ